LRPDLPHPWNTFLTNRASAAAESGGRDVSAAEAEFAAASGITVIFLLILYFFIAFFPCIVFLCAWNQCISDHQKRGEQPTCCAWATCLIIFGVTCLTTLGVGIPWLILPFFMIIPFCMDSCYEGNGRGGNNVTVIHQTQSPVPQMQMQPMQQMQPPPCVPALAISQRTSVCVRIVF